MDLNEMMAQAQDLQARVRDAQESLNNVRVKGLSKNGAVIIEMTGKYDVTNVIISDNAMTLSAQELANIVQNALQDAKDKADVIINKTMLDATGGVELPF